MWRLLHLLNTEVNNEMEKLINETRVFIEIH